MSAKAMGASWPSANAPSPVFRPQPRPPPVSAPVIRLFSALQGGLESSYTRPWVYRWLVTHPTEPKMSLPHITSSYRLFLRATSAAVMHHSKATRNLRLLWRPIFDAAASNAKKLGDARYAPEHQKLRSWLSEWDRRVDGTLSLLVNAATSRGLPHTVVRNLALMTGTHIRRSFNAGFGVRAPWKPSLPLNSPEYKVFEPHSREYARIAKLREMRARSEQALGAFSEVVRMAESRHHLTLGRVLPR